MTAQRRAVESVLRWIERQHEAFGFASAEFWQRLEGALTDLSGHELPRSMVRRLDRVFHQ